MVKRALLVAFHYPPVKGSSGVQRTLSFSRYLQAHGWQPEVLTVRDSAYVLTGDDQMADIPDDVRVNRALALDAKRHLSLFGSYPQAAALPDRWSSWRFDGVRRGMAIIRARRPDVIWSTFPISTAHRIGMTLARKSGIPWVADCRDSMTEEDFPKDPKVFAAIRALETEVVRHADAVTFTTPGAIDMYAQRYPDIPAARWQLIENGYDEAAFDGLRSRGPDASGDGPVTLVHAGILYPYERDPSAFFVALAGLKRDGGLGRRGLRVVLRATGHDAAYREQIRRHGIDDIVELAPGIAYREALQEMLLADGLLIFQAANCNHQIPAKAYEYMRAGRPILALTDPAGDTARLLTDNGHRHVCPLDDAAAIRESLARYVVMLENVNNFPSEAGDPARYSRQAQTGRLAALFNDLSRNPT